MGRPRIDLLIPPFPFTTADLKAQNPCVSAFVIQRNLEGWLADGIVRRAGTRARVGTGKAFYVYESVPAPKDRPAARNPRSSSPATTC